MDEERRAATLLEEISRYSRTPVRFMEVCGTHTTSIFRSGMRALLPDTIELISGPGCPVCVTPTGDIDRIIALARLRDVILVTFGDVMRVPGTTSSLHQERATGADIRVILSPLDAVEIAHKNPDRKIIFFSVGFETTSPAIAASVIEAHKRGLANFFILPSQKLIPPAIRALLSTGKVRIDGFILPGHVSVVIGKTPYLFVASEYGLPGVITGFEPFDILEGIYMLLRQKAEGRSTIETQYKRAVRDEGNKVALGIIEEVFKPIDARWRGIGVISASGLCLKPAFSYMDASAVFDIPYENSDDPPGCLCGEVIQGLIKPFDCPLFGQTCRPESPIGPCMVSSEGSCAAYYRYGRTS